MNKEMTKSLQVKIKGREKQVMAVCYRPPNQKDGADEALYR